MPPLRVVYNLHHIVKVLNYEGNFSSNFDSNFFLFDTIFSVILKLVFYIYNTFNFRYFFQNVELGLV